MTGLPTPALPARAPRFTRFDRVVWAAMAAIIGAIALTIALGDRVGVSIHRAAPQGEARSTSTVLIEFSEPMDRASVAERFSITPEIAGTLAWSGRTLLFRPAQALPPGAAITATLASGARSESGRELLHDVVVRFTVRRPQVAFLAPANATPMNIWMADPTQPDGARQITSSPSGIYDFSISPDGGRIAFSENNTDLGTQDIKILDLDSGALIQATNCLDAACTNPVWRPDGSTIAYERVEFNSDLAQQGVGVSPTRIWLLDLTSLPVQTRPLFSDPQLLGHTPQWSADGQRIAMYDVSMGAILVYDLQDDSLTAVPSRAGSSGALSPDGRLLVFPEIVLQEDASAHSYLRMADLDSNSITFLSDAPQEIDDARAVWRPDGQVLAVARRDLTTRGYQIALLDPFSGSMRWLTDDPRYTNMFFSWDAAGEQLVLHRFPELDESGALNMNGQPEIWTLDVASGALTLVARNAFLPRWVP